MILTKELSKEDQADILWTIFGFHFDEDVLIDDNGDEFFAHQPNCQFNFNDLAGVLGYLAHKSKNNGYEDAKREIRKALGIV